MDFETKLKEDLNKLEEGELTGDELKEIGLSPDDSKDELPSDSEDELSSDRPKKRARV